MYGDVNRCVPHGVDSPGLTSLPSHLVSYVKFTELLEQIVDPTRQLIHLYSCLIY